MSYETRIQGFVLCFIMGWILSFCSVIAISMVNIPGFVLLYSFGNIISIFATLFLMGPMRQLKSMFAPVRVVATIVFIGMLIATIIVAIKTRNFVLVLICVILQFFAGLWYSLSYIPYGTFDTLIGLKYKLTHILSSGNDLISMLQPGHYLSYLRAQVFITCTYAVNSQAFITFPPALLSLHSADWRPIWTSLLMPALAMTNLPEWLLQLLRPLPLTLISLWI